MKGAHVRQEHRWSLSQEPISPQQRQGIELVVQPKGALPGSSQVAQHAPAAAAKLEQRAAMPFGQHLPEGQVFGMLEGVLVNEAGEGVNGILLD